MPTGCSWKIVHTYPVYLNRGNYREHQRPRKSAIWLPERNEYMYDVTSQRPLFLVIDRRQEGILRKYSGRKKRIQHRQMASNCMGIPKYVRIVVGSYFRDRVLSYDTEAGTKR